MGIKLSGLTSGMDTESMVTELMKAQRMKSTKIENKITKVGWTQDKWKDLNTKLYSFYTGPLSKMRMQGSFNTKKVSSSDESKAEISANTAAPDGTHLLKIKQLASAQFVTGKQLGTDLNSNTITSKTKLTDLGFVADENNKISIDAGKKVITIGISETTTVGSITNALKDAGLNASYDTSQKRFFISSKESGYTNAFSISTAGTVDLSKLGLSTITKTNNGDGTVSVTGDSNIKLVAPADAKAIYNGAELTSTTNTLTANGVTINLKGVTKGLDTADTSDDETISLSVSNNTKEIYDMIKGFVKSYNELTTGMSEAYYADSSKGFEPLTEDEKSSMTDDQITKWEDKIKNSLLRRDNTLSSLLDNMRSSLSESVEVNGKKYSLSSFGIGSENYSEKGLLHIKGDADDSLVSGFEDKLMKALTEDPDTVMKVFNELAGDLYEKMTDNMSSTTLRSALTFYNDKEMTKTVTNYKSDLKKMEDRLKDMENRYYKQFSAMESAMTKMNSESSSLASMLGTNSN
ncbi:MAG: hypothetical protein K0S01_3071 [Herbinix sp.]|jgi:flagellar hook-associated protein 2|nr:hypothetical protein [Herbinix sp.]